MKKEKLEWEKEKMKIGNEMEIEKSNLLKKIEILQIEKNNYCKSWKQELERMKKDYFKLKKEKETKCSEFKVCFFFPEFQISAHGPSPPPPGHGVFSGGGGLLCPQCAPLTLSATPTLPLHFFPKDLH